MFVDSINYPRAMTSCDSALLKVGLPSTYYLSLAVDHQEELGHLQLNNPTLKDPMTYRMSQMSSLGFYSSAYAHVKKVATTLSPTKSSKLKTCSSPYFAVPSCTKWPNWVHYQLHVLHLLKLLLRLVVLKQLEFCMSHSLFLKYLVHYRMPNSLSRYIVATKKKIILVFILTLKHVRVSI